MTSSVVLDAMSSAWLGPICMIIAIMILISPRYIRLLVSYSLNYRQRSEKQSLQAQITEYRKELSGISQVNEFAKYSKVQRKLRAATDQLNNIARKDLELNFKYVLAGQALAWVIAIIFLVRLIYQLYQVVAEGLGFI